MRRDGFVPVAGMFTRLSPEAERLYDRLCNRFDDKIYIYTAEEWENELLVPLGYVASDQSEVSHALAELEKAKLIRRQSVRSKGGFHARRRQHYPRPRKVEITILPC